jgi:hypothetical protein
MGDRYDSIVEFEDKLHQRTKGFFLEERLIFAEMAELILSPLEHTPTSFEGVEGHKKSVIGMLISRMFNDFEAAKLLILTGLCEQAYMPVRDSIECMMLIRLFDVDDKRALRWVKRTAQYSPKLVKQRLDELGIEAPEYAFYGPMSMFGHANVLGSVTHVQEKDAGKGALLREYHFGGFANYKWIGMELQMLLVHMLFALVGPLTQIYTQYLPDPDDWRAKVILLVPRLQKCGIDVGMDYDESREVGGEGQGSSRVDKILLRVRQTLFDMDTINEAELTADQILGASSPDDEE